MNFVTSDLHFGHKNIIEYCSRPFSDVQEMDKVLIDNWNSVVGEKDTVYHLGDFAFKKRMDGHDGSDLDFESLLNGKIVFIKGNHDSKQKNCIAESMIIRHDGHRIHLNHYPEHASPDMLSLVGHVHDNWKIRYPHTKYIAGGKGFPVVNVGVDVWDFRPVTIEQIKLYIKELRHGK